ncbi:MAG: hypothetical protein ACTSRS_05340 [Candidatus Helarchaeota archaeon]
MFVVKTLTSPTWKRQFIKASEINIRGFKMNFELETKFKAMGIRETLNRGDGYYQ